MYKSTVTPNWTMTSIFRIASILGIIAALVNPLLDTGESESRKILESVSLIIISILVFITSFLITASAQVTEGKVVLRCAWIFSAKIPVTDIARAVDDSNFGNAGFGYRILGKNHRGFIMGGPQATLHLHDGRQYTVSVDCVDEFCAAINKQKT